MSESFWASLSAYCTELAPVSGPLLSAVGDTAAAIERAGNPSRRISAQVDRLEVLLQADD